jgi:hypothetical protein
VLCSWHKTKSHICQYRQPFMEWLNLESIGDKKITVTKSALRIDALPQKMGCGFFARKMFA